MEISKDSLGSVIVYFKLFTSSLVHVDLWKFPKTGSGKTDSILQPFTMALADLWKFPKTGVDKNHGILYPFTISLVDLWKFQKTGSDKTDSIL